MNISQVDNTLNISSTAYSGYTYIHAIQSVTINEVILVNDVFTTAASSYNFLTDGYFIIIEIKLPTTPGEYYYISDEIIYNPEGEEITVEQLLDIDVTDTNISRVDEDYTTIYYLNDYYLALLRSKYLKNICNCGCGCIDKQDKVRLDTLTMGLDLIEALIGKAQYYEVQRIVEKLMICFGIVENNCNCT